MPQLVAKNICLRFATEPSEGEGWSEYEGTDWVRPLPNWGSMVVEDASDDPRSIVFDTNDNKPYELGTWDRGTYVSAGPKDKDSTEVAWEKHLRSEVVGPGDKHLSIEDDVTNIHIEPSDSNNRGQTGYDSKGIRSAQELSLEAFIDGERITPKGIATDFPDDGDVVFTGVDLKGKKIQKVLKGTAGEILVTGISCNYFGELADGTNTERTMTEDGYQLEFETSKVVHLTRGFPLYNRVTQESYSADYTSTDGPDGRSNSGAVYTNGLSLANSAIAGSYTVLLWAKTLAPMGALALTPYSVDAYDGWYLLYLAGVGLAANQAIDAGESVFDFRLYSAEVSTAAIAHYYRNVIHNEGIGYLPGF